MKKLLAALSLVFAFGPLNPLAAENVTSWKEFFKQTQGEIVDFAILSAVEPGYFKDFITGQNLTGAQTPIVYVTPYISGDFGYITGFNTSENIKGAPMLGMTLRINKLLDDYFYGQVTATRNVLPVVGNNWDRLWFGPWVSWRISSEEDTFLAGVKGGLSF